MTEKQSNLKILCHNSENLFYYNKENINSIQNRSEHKLKELAKHYTYYDCDIMFLSEVGGLESLKNFNRNYLNSNYILSVIPGNSERGIELAVLVHKRIIKQKQYSFAHLSHKHLKFNLDDGKGPLTSFKRDILEFRVQNITSGIEDYDPKRPPELIFFFVHLKSQWDREGGDFKGERQRSAEVRELIRIANKRFAKYPNTPLIALGDFNGHAEKKETSTEFKPLHNGQLHFEWIELFDFLDIPHTPADLRATSIHFDKNGAPLMAHLDYIFVTQNLLSKIDKDKSGRCQFINKKNNPVPFPQSPQSRASLCSDHMPLILTLNLNSM